jgi:hypothetical protein
MNNDFVFTGKTSVLVNIVWLSIAILLVFALLGEWKNVTDNTSKSREAFKNAASLPLGSPGYCDTIAYATQLSQTRLNADNIQWRRSLIASAILTIVAPVFLSTEFSSKQSLILLTVSWVVFSGVIGYTDYHLERVSNTAVNDILQLAISRFDPATCNPLLINTI